MKEFQRRRLQGLKAKIAILRAEAELLFNGIEEDFKNRCAREDEWEFTAAGALAETEVEETGGLLYHLEEADTSIQKALNPKDDES